MDEGKNSQLFAYKKAEKKNEAEREKLKNRIASGWSCRQLFAYAYLTDTHFGGQGHVKGPGQDSSSRSSSSRSS